MSWFEGAAGTRVHYEVLGTGPALLLGYPFTASPGNAAFAPVDLREEFVEPLARSFRVIVADYPRATGQTTGAKASLVTRDTVAADMLALADAAGVDRFAWWGYSWGAVNGLNLACTSERVAALVAGGWPPLTTDFTPIHAMSAGVERDMLAIEGLSDDQRELACGFRNFYDDILATGWPADSVRSLTIPRLAYVGDKDSMVQGGVELHITDPWLVSEAELRALGWETHLIRGGLDHLGAMTSARDVLPVVSAFLEAHAPRD